METLSRELKGPLVELLLSLADDKLMLGHRNAEWTGLGPILEEDIAFSALAQDELAHAQTLYEFIAELTGENADALAYGRPPAEYRCAALVEAPDDLDWGKAVFRQFLCAHFNALRLDRMTRSSYSPLAAWAARVRAEEQIHIEHADGWIQRLSRGTEESHQRLQAAVHAFGPLASGLCQPTSDVDRLEAVGLYPGQTAEMNKTYLAGIAHLLSASNLSYSDNDFLPPSIPASGGRTGQHSSVFAEALDELAEVYRVEPNARW